MSLKQMLNDAFNELSKELNNPEFDEIFNPEDLESMYIVYKRISSFEDKAIIITHMMSEMILQERGILK